MGKKPRGGQRKEIDYQRAEEVAALGPTQKLFINYFKLDRKTIDKRIKEHFGVSLSEFLEQRRAPLQAKLMSVAIDLAIKHKNVTMIIFLLKNYCGFSDKREVKQEVTQEANQNKVAIVLPDQMRDKVEKLKKLKPDFLVPPPEEEREEAG